VCLERLTRRPAALEQLRPATTVRPVREAEKELYASALTAAAGSVSRAARVLGVSRGKLYRKIRLYGLL
jgi:transcriptional regulator of acetoin/glycerol metabolism